jgi:hypothetical protein
MLTETKLMTFCVFGLVVLVLGLIAIKFDIPWILQWLCWGAAGVSALFALWFVVTALRR